MLWRLNRNSVILRCGLYILKRKCPLALINAVDLMKARDSAAHVRSINQRFFSLLRERKRV